MITLDYQSNLSPKRVESPSLGSVWVIGKFVVDMFAGCSNLARESQRVRIDWAEEYPGGPGLNVSVALAKLGDVQVNALTAIGPTGANGLFHRAAEYWEPCGNGGQHGMKLSRPVRIVSPRAESNLRSDYTQIILARNQEPRFYYRPGASVRITRALLEAHIDEMAEARGIYLGGLGTLEGLECADIAEVLKQVRNRRGGRSRQMIVVDVAFVSKERARKLHYHLGYLLEQADFVVPNAKEAQQYSARRKPVDSASVFNTFLHRGTVIKQGADGCTLFEVNADGGAGVHVPARAVSPDAIRSSVGAGDVWGAAFLHALLRGEGAAEACRFGNAVAAHSLRCVGATGNLMDWRKY